MGTAKKKLGTVPEPGDPFRFRGNDYEVNVVDEDAGAIQIKRPDDVQKSQGHYRLTDGKLLDVAWAPEGFWYFRGCVAESMRGLPIDEVRAVQMMRSYGDGRDDLALEAFHGEPRGIPGAKSVFHGREHLRPASRGLFEHPAGGAPTEAERKAEDKRARRKAARTTTNRGG